MIRERVTFSPRLIIQSKNGTLITSKPDIEWAESLTRLMFWRRWSRIPTDFASFAKERTVR